MCVCEFNCHSLPPKFGQTALHEASKKGNVSMVEFLMANFNADLDAKDSVSQNLLKQFIISYNYGRTSLRQTLLRQIYA